VLEAAAADLVGRVVGSSSLELLLLLLLGIFSSSIPLGQGPVTYRLTRLLLTRLPGRGWFEWAHVDGLL
jgi:hypothetical protein